MFRPLLLYFVTCHDNHVMLLWTFNKVAKCCKNILLESLAFLRKRNGKMAPELPLLKRLGGVDRLLQKHHLLTMSLPGLLGFWWGRFSPGQTHSGGIPVKQEVRHPTDPTFSILASFASRSLHHNILLNFLLWGCPQCPHSKWEIPKAPCRLLGCRLQSSNPPTRPYLPKAIKKTPPAQRKIFFGQVYQLLEHLVSAWWWQIQVLICLNIYSRASNLSEMASPSDTVFWNMSTISKPTHRQKTPQAPSGSSSSKIRTSATCGTRNLPLDTPKRNLVCFGRSLFPKIVLRMN